MTIHMVQMETDHFFFQAFGHTEGEAKESLRRAWNKHRRATGATFTFREAVEAYSLSGHEIVVGKTYVDQREA